MDKPVSTATQTAIDIALTSVIILQGNWDADTNTPDITGTTITGHTWLVTVAGGTDLGGITNWAVDDMAVKTDTGWIKRTSSSIVSKWGSISGLLSDQSDLQNALDTKENALGNPTEDGMKLVSTIAGVRSWTKDNGGEAIYTPLVSPTLETPNKHGGVPAGTPASALDGKTISEMLDLILFETILAHISTTEAASLSIGITETKLEIGTVITNSTTTTFNKGRIINGDNSQGPELVGDAINYTLFFNGTQVGSPSTSNIIDDTNRIIVSGANQWQTEVSYNAGTGDYYDNKGDTGTYLDSERIADTVFSNPKTIQGGYMLFTGTKTDQIVPTTSTEVRSLAYNTILSSTNSGVYYLPIPTSSKMDVICVPDGTNVAVFNETSNQDVSDVFNDVNTITYVDVTDGSGSTTVRYKVLISKHTSYSTPQTFRITMN